LRYRLKICSFPKELIGKKFYEAVILIYKSQQKFFDTNPKRPYKKPLKSILFGIVPPQEKTIYISSIVNPGSEYTIRPEDKAYLMV